MPLATASFYYFNVSVDVELYVQGKDMYAPQNIPLPHKW